MARGRINVTSVTNKALSSKKLQLSLEVKAKNKLAQARTKMENDFNIHPVSMEIKGGASASNSTRTLSGYGNLFTFIGFPAGSRPIQAIASLIRRQAYLIKNSGKTKRAGRNKVIKTYQINYADLTDINSLPEAQMPWEAGSWVEGIEKGISSFSSYMYGKFEASRSRKGIIAKKKGEKGGSPQNVRMGSFSTMSYVTRIINDFRREISR